MQTQSTPTAPTSTVPTIALELYQETSEQVELLTSRTSEVASLLRGLEAAREKEGERVEDLERTLAEASGSVAENEDKIQELMVRFNHYVQSFNKVTKYS